MIGQSAIRLALLNPALAVPAGLTDPAGRPAGKRFDIYRNNVVLSLIEALQSSFPVIRKLLGDEFFDAMAHVYLRQHPPSSPLLMYYGAAMPGFVAGFPPVRHLGYLPDIARLEQAMRQSYHAADTGPLDPQALVGLPQDRLEHLRLTLTPATRLIRSQWPIHAIWAFNTRVDAPNPVMEPQDVLILRPAFDPLPHLIPPGGGALISALIEGQPLGQAVSAAPGADLSATLTLLVQGGAIHSLTCEA